MKIFLERVENLRHFIGKSVERFFLLAVFVGIFWFAVESSFVFVIQGFLLSLGLMQNTPVNLPSWFPRDLMGSVLALVGFGFLRALTLAAKNFLAELTNQSFIRHQRGLLVRHALEYAPQHPSHHIITLFTERMAQSGGVLFQATVIINSSIALLLFMAYGCAIAPKELFLGLFLLVIIFFPFRIMNKYIQKYSQRVVELGEGLNKLVIVGMRNFFFLKLFHLLPNEISKAKTSLAEYESMNRSFYFLAAVRYGYPQFAGVLTISFMTYIGLHYFKTPGVILLSLFYLFLRLVQSASDINVAIGHIRYALPGFRILYQWQLKAAREIHEMERQESLVVQKPLPKVELNIQAQNLSFGYESEKLLFSNLNFTLRKSQVLLIRGPSGSGKSTLVSVLLGLLKPKNGQVLINQIPVEEVRADLIEKIAYVGPDPYLVQGTLRENLCYGSKFAENSFTDQQLWMALEKAQMTELVKSFKKGLDEPLNENAQLSTGQKQRLAIARALLRNPQILILDEATANLDTDTEAKLIESFQALRQDVISIVVSHKDAFNKMADFKLVLGSGT